jgi:hypothetical protein
MGVDMSSLIKLMKGRIGFSESKKLASNATTSS